MRTAEKKREKWIKGFIYIYIQHRHTHMHTHTFIHPTIHTHRIHIAKINPSFRLILFFIALNKHFGVPKQCSLTGDVREL